MKRGIAICIALFICIIHLPALLLAADDSMNMDPFYAQSVNKDTSPVDTISENVDPFSGNLSVVQTDIHLPGNGGLDLNIVRSYKSSIWGRRTGVTSPGFLLQYEPSSVGVGWSMHMGILRNPRGNGGNNNVWLPNNPVFELPDGSQQVFFKDKNNTANFISKDFWTMTVSSIGTQDVYTITAPDGIVYTAELGTGNGGYTLYGNRLIAQVTSIRNAAGNATILVSYNKIDVDKNYYIKTITDSVGRVLTFNYYESIYYDGNYMLENITLNSKIFKYTYTPIKHNNTNFYYLETFKPPVINAWSYEYDNLVNTYQMTKIKFPTGGKISYGYDNTVFAVGTTTTSFRVVTSKKTSGTGITEGTWNYAYSSYISGGSANVTTITAPGVTETHSFYGWGNTGNGNVWKVGLPMSKVYSGDFTKTESYTWDKGTQISDDVLSSASWAGSSGTVSDSDIYVPFLSAKSIIRDGKTYSTAYTYSYTDTDNNQKIDTYGNPHMITESGDLSGAVRESKLSYWTNTSKNIVKGKPLTEIVTDTAGKFTGSSKSAWEYDENSGNVTKITKDGVTTTYDYDTLHGNKGNLYSVKDANDHIKTYQWSNGRISKETNAIDSSICRTINSNGTIADEKDGRSTDCTSDDYKTTFDYDELLRLTKITPPAGNPTVITYPNPDGSIRNETRGGYSTIHTFDGFGRPSGSSDSKGVTTTIAYTPYGTKDYEDTNIGDKISYDYFGRVKQILHKDTPNTSITYTYGTSTANELTITDEKPKNTKLTYTVFGNPDEKYLMSVYDAEEKTTTYTRNIQGNLTSITQGISGAFTRSFGYHTTYKNFLVSETNPETGTINYERDKVGNMTSKTYPSTLKTSYTYDKINRLTGITAGSSSTIGFGYDKANNRISMDYPGGSADYVYDSINRMTQKAESIDGYSYTTVFDYDGNDNLEQITYPSGRKVSYTYNPFNEVTSITGFGSSVTSVEHYTDGTYRGMLQSYILPHGTTTFTYNSRNLTTAIDAGSALDVSYAYDTRGNTTSYTNGFFDSQSFDYDNLNRLISFRSASWNNYGSFGYDDTGNRSSKAVGSKYTSYSYANNRVSSTSGAESATYTYNTKGLLTGGSHTLSYDNFDNLASVIAGTTTLASFAYDGDGQRVSKTTNGKKSIYHYDLGGRTLSEDDSSNQIVDYIYLEGKLIAKVVSSFNGLPGDCDNNNTVSIAEVQSAINMFLGIKPVAGCVDINSDGAVAINEVQKTINSFLGIPAAPTSMLQTASSATIAKPSNTKHATTATAVANVASMSLAATSVNLDLGGGSGTPGSKITLPVILTNSTGTNVVSLQTDINYDPAVLENPTASLGPVGIDADKSTLRVYSAGVFRIGVVGVNDNPLADGVVVKVSFTIKPTATTGSVVLNNTPVVNDRFGELMPVTGSNGVINIVLP